MLHFTPHIQTQSPHTLWTHTAYVHRTHTLAQAPDHRYCALHESLSTVRTVQCIVGWSYAHAHTVPYLFISALTPQPLSLSLIVSSSLSLSLSLTFRGRVRGEELTEAMLFIEHGRVNEYLMLFPLSLSLCCSFR